MSRRRRRKIFGNNIVIPIFVAVFLEFLILVPAAWPATKDSAALKLFLQVTSMTFLLSHRFSVRRPTADRETRKKKPRSPFSPRSPVDSNVVIAEANTTSAANNRQPLQNDHCSR